MSTVRLVTVGKLKERYWTEAQAEYVKRLRPYIKFEIKELNDLPIPERAGAAKEEQIRLEEEKLIKEAILPQSFLVTLDLRGKQITSPELSEFLTQRLISGRPVTLVIGGSLGLTENLVKQADLNLSFSKLTFPHQLFRIMLLEQIYRACKIMRNESYHK